MHSRLPSELPRDFHQKSGDLLHDLWSAWQWQRRQDGSRL
jgi:hypothetical protein